MRRVTNYIQHAYVTTEMQIYTFTAMNLNYFFSLAQAQLWNCGEKFSGVYQLLFIILCLIMRVRL